MPYPSKLQLEPTPWWMRPSLYWAFFLTIALLNAASTMIDNPALPKWKPLVWELSSMTTVGLVYPLVRSAARRFPVSGKPVLLTLAIHAVFLIAFSAAHTSGMMALRKIVYSIVGESYSVGGASRVLYEFYKDMILYPLLVGFTAGLDNYNKYRENQFRSEQLQRRLVEAQLQNLRGQLNPHFLFNTLNMISARMYEDVADADRMITRLSDLLRMTLRNASDQEVPLATELEMLEIYLDIMQTRFQDSIRVRIDVDAAARPLLVPPLLLQPLVENSFRHGPGVRAEGGLVEIFGRTSNGTLSLVVRDNGPGIQTTAEQAAAKGVGLSNAIARLQQLYGDRQSFHIRNRTGAEGGGLEVAIEVPARPGH
jgi:two-component system, LytTR family, sensor kinase